MLRSSVNFTRVTVTISRQKKTHLFSLFPMFQTLRITDQLNLLFISCRLKVSILTFWSCKCSTLEMIGLSIEVGKFQKTPGDSRWKCLFAVAQHIYQRKRRFEPLSLDIRSHIQGTNTFCHPCARYRIHPVYFSAPLFYPSKNSTISEKQIFHRICPHITIFSNHQQAKTSE